VLASIVTTPGNLPLSSRKISVFVIMVFLVFGGGRIPRDNNSAVDKRLKLFGNFGNVGCSVAKVERIKKFRLYVNRRPILEDSDKRQPLKSSEQEIIGRCIIHAIISLSFTLYHKRILLSREIYIDSLMYHKLWDLALTISEYYATIVLRMNNYNPAKLYKKSRANLILICYTDNRKGETLWIY
jgi:hypothetical protein